MEGAGPIVRAPLAFASCLDFSRICFFLSSSLVMMLTRSSGISLFSLNEELKRIRSAILLSFSLFAKFFL